MSENAIAVIPQELTVTEVKAQVTKIHALMSDLMQEGTHYGKSYPGDTKKNLLKPGADKLCFMFRLRPDFTQEIKELPGGHMEVLTKCTIYHIESGQKIAEGVGLASTMESKYRWRYVSKKCPACGKETIIKGKEEYGGGYICYTKKGGCGEKFEEDDPAITGQICGKAENPDIADTYNTVIKISKKRAYVDATITSCAASDIFTQDAEDFTNENGNTLAREAASEKDKEIAGNEIGGILKSVNPTGRPYFSKEEVAAERLLFKKEKSIRGVRLQYERLKKDLENRAAEFDETVPFGDAGKAE